MPVLLYLFLFLMVAPLSAQEKPTLEAVRTEAPIRIDGRLDDSGWSEAAVATGFTTLRPNPGQPASQPTEVRVLYDDRGLYIGARMLDSEPDSILAELTERDDIGNTDLFGFVLDPY